MFTTFKNDFFFFFFFLSDRQDFWGIVLSSLPMQSMSDCMSHLAKIHVSSSWQEKACEMEIDRAIYDPDEAEMHPPQLSWVGMMWCRRATMWARKTEKIRELMLFSRMGWLEAIWEVMWFLVIKGVVWLWAIWGAKQLRVVSMLG